jgi:hypothetical protein
MNSHFFCSSDFAVFTAKLLMSGVKLGASRRRLWILSFFNRGLYLFLITFIAENACSQMYLQPELHISVHSFLSYENLSRDRIRQNSTFFPS